MALFRSKINEIPEDAVILSENEAFQHQWNIIKDWKPTKDVWAVRNTAGILGVCSAMTSVFVNQHYRSRLKLANYGKFSTYLPIVVIPAMFSMVTHNAFIQQSLILNPLGECPLCVQLRAAILQTGFGVAYPTVLAPLAALMFATRHYTYRLPSITQEPKAVLQLWLKFTRPITPVLSAAAIGQSLLTMYLTYKTAEQTMRIQHLMQREEQRQEEQLQF